MARDDPNKLLRADAPSEQDDPNANNPFGLESDDVQEFYLQQYAADDAANRPRHKKYTHHRTNADPKLGDFIRPDSTNWEDYRDDLHAEKLAFNPEHSNFDSFIADSSRLPALKKPTDKRYERYEPLRDNVATIRNFILMHFFPDGSVDAGHDQEKLICVGQIAESMGDMIYRGSHIIKNPFGTSVQLNISNSPHEGATAIYKELVKQQNNGMFSLGSLIGGSANKPWKLPPVEQTPFREKHISASLPANPNVSNTQHDSSLLAQAAMPVAALSAEVLAQLDLTGSADEMLSSGLNFRPVDSLQHPVKRDAIREAKNILDKLKVLFTDTSIDQLLVFKPDDLKTLMTNTRNVSAIFNDHLEMAKTLDPMLEFDPSIRDAVEAYNVLGTQALILEAAHAEQHGDTQKAAELQAAIAESPAEWRHPKNITLGSLLDKLQAGLDKATKQLDLLANDAMSQPEEYNLAAESPMQPSNTKNVAAKPQEMMKRAEQNDQAQDMRAARQARRNNATAMISQLRQNAGASQAARQGTSREAAHAATRNSSKNHDAFKASKHQKMQGLLTADMPSISQSMKTTGKMGTGEALQPSSTKQVIRQQRTQQEQRHQARSQNKAEQQRDETRQSTPNASTKDTSFTR